MIPELTSKTYCAGTLGENVSEENSCSDEYDSGPALYVISTTFLFASSQIISRGKCISFIQNESLSGAGNTNNMAVSVARLNRSDRPCSRSDGVSASSYLNV